MATTAQPPYKAGETVIGRASGLPKMTVINCTSEKVNVIYYNTVTGKFETKDLPVIAVKRPVATSVA